MGEFIIITLTFYPSPIKGEGNNGDENYISLFSKAKSPLYSLLRFAQGQALCERGKMTNTPCARS